MNQHIHLIGIGGTGLSAIARLLKEQGYTVSGSDRALSPLARQLMEAGVQVFIGHTAANIKGADLVVRSSAVTDDNPEVAAALQAGIPVLKRSEFLGRLMESRTGVAVAGTHGKTTTTAMIAWLLARLGQDPSYIIGGVSKNLNGNAHAGRGNAFVIEADEYDRMFLGLQPAIAVVTNMEHDHPDCFPTPADYRQAFEQFVQRLRPGGCLITCADDHGSLSLISALPAHTYALTYGLYPAANYTAVNVSNNPYGGFSFTVMYNPPEGGRMNLGEVQLSMPGEHNVRNALAAIAVAHELGLSLVAATTALEEFTGTGRRFDLRGEINGITIIDDYAHHPTEIRATLSAARSRYADRRVWAVWQPHTYSRTQSLFDEFSTAFADADQVLVTEVYAAREAGESFSAEQIVKNIPHPSARFTSGLDDAEQILLAELKPGDVLIVLSAGDADQISSAVLTHLANKETSRA